MPARCISLIHLGCQPHREHRCQDRRAGDFSGYRIGDSCSRLCAFVSREETFFDRTDLTPQFSLTHSLSFTVN
ncbi:hypothetical protein E2C01_093971 [Portunus trituberculatus]|uniref:Uncharacterized protein n=1 Tax=Portunus trituberculatus TaxID=210409 RepID=A0A5B7JZK2_PORTR|nr:hypothetical protein [Portunus trituberculatus]